MRQRLICYALAAAMALPATAAGADGWGLLRDLRARLEAAPQIADFQQEFVPAGFTSGDRESGRLLLALPDCLRWDYDEPFPKSYLLCGETVWTWNPGESSGRTFAVDPAEERGLDLLRLGVERLAERYEAELVDGGGEGAAVRLVPSGETTEIAEATLVLAAAGSLRRLSYRDVEGNTTRFEFSGHRPLDRRSADLRPPAELSWIED